MPATAQGSGTGTPPINILVGPPGGGSAQSVTDLIDWSTISIEETGNQEGATFDAVLLDRSQTFAQMRGRWRLLVNWRNPVSGTMTPMFRGFITTPSPDIKAIYGELAIHAEDCGTLLDRIVIGTKGLVAPAGQSDKQRIQWLFNRPARDGVPIGQPLFDMGLTSWAKVQTLRANMPKQTFPARLTLRQAIERVLSQASDTDSADYFMDHEPRLWTFDSDTINTVLDRTPYDINTASSPGAGKVAPEDLNVEWDADGMFTGYFVEAANAAVSKFYWDSDQFPDLANRLPSPYGVNLYGRLAGNISAPDANTNAKAQRVAKAALRDTRNPVPRISFSVSGTSTYDASTGERWRGGQRLYVTSPVHGLNGSGTDAGPWAGSNGSNGALLQPFRVKRATTTFESGAGTMRVQIEAGGRRKVLYQGSSG